MLLNSSILDFDTFCDEISDHGSECRKWNAKVGARTADYFRPFERCIEFTRCQDDVVARIEVADNSQAFSSVVLVVRTAGEHDNSHTETDI